jgi:hypothetical protein
MTEEDDGNSIGKVGSVVAASVVDNLKVLVSQLVTVFRIFAEALIRLLLLASDSELSEEQEWQIDSAQLEHTAGGWGCVSTPPADLEVEIGHVAELAAEEGRRTEEEEP